MSEERDDRPEARNGWTPWTNTWGLNAFTGSEYYLPSLVNVPPRKPRLRHRLKLFALYLIWSAVLLEAGFFLGRFYEAHP